ncbi:MAG: ABC transporter permease [Limnochordales bacterium]|nr:ABC transporter permease [Limnochordales bacterium]
MARFLVRRLVHGVPTVLLVSFLVFGAMHLAPGDPAALLMGQAAARPENAAALERLRAEMGLDKPFLVQYVTWLSGVLRLDFGTSNRSGLPVLDLILGRLPATLELVAAAFILSLLLAVPAGVIAALRRGSMFDRLLMIFAVGGVAVPGFWLGMTLILLFAVQLQWLPSSGYVPFFEDPVRNLRHLILPAVTLAVYLLAVFSRFLRAEMIETLRQDYIRTALAKGLSMPVVAIRHGLRNTLTSLWTIMGMELGSLLGGVVIVEQVFGWSGIGWLAVQAVNNQDYPLVQAIVLMIAVGFTVINIVVDIGYALLNPRVRVDS